MVEWAVRNASDTVLEPSFGAGVFVGAVIQRLRELGCDAPESQVHGYETDPHAILEAKRVHGDVQGLQLEDFIAVNPPTEESQKFDCVIGNPPFIRHHNMQHTVLVGERRRSLSLNRAADVSCIFTLHALEFIRNNGRLSIILPAAILFADYAKAARERLRRDFKEITVTQLPHRTFATSGALERGVVVLASGYRRGSEPKLKGRDCTSIKSIVADHDCSDNELTASRLRWKLPLDRPVALQGLLPTRPLSDFMVIRIGLVTGANSYFLIDDSTRHKFGIPIEQLTPIISRRRGLLGLKFGTLDHDVARTCGGKVWLVSALELGVKGSPLRRYLSTIPRPLRRETLWLKKRPIWHYIDPNPMPDAVLTYMSHKTPRAILLSREVTATNSFHHIIFNSGYESPIVRQAICLSLITSVAQLSAEINGRSYGGGVLKLEPSEAKAILLPDLTQANLRDVGRAFRIADQLLRVGHDEEAIDIADRTILKPLVGMGFASIQKNVLGSLRSIRDGRIGRVRQ
jgi:adenine-specific DNA methylase